MASATTSPTSGNEFQTIGVVATIRSVIVAALAMALHAGMARSR